MNERTKTGLEILQAAVLMGVLGNILLRATPWGLNASLFVTAFTAAMIMIAVRRRPEILTLQTLALQGAMVFFGAMFVIRDSIELRVFDTIVILIIMGVLVLPNFNVIPRVAGAFHYVAGFVWSGVSSLFAPFVLLGSDVEWKAMPGNRLSRHLFAVLRGLAIALPLVLIFGALFMAADAAFEGLVNRVVNIDLERVVSHIVLTSLFAWLTAGYFRGTLIEHFRPAVPADPKVSPIPKTDETPNTEARRSDDSFVANFASESAETGNALPDNATVLEHINRSDPPNPSESAVETKPRVRNWQDFDNTSFPAVFTFGKVETIIILGLVNALFLSFVIIQVPYLFGGMELVQNTPDFKLAEYARRGFGELVTVAALVLPILLLSHWLLRRDEPANEKIYRIFAGIQIALLFVIMASAGQRLILLTGNLGYGMTTVRLYPMIFMIWLAIVFLWFGMTVLRGARQYFAWGALWSAFFVLGATHVLNPDEFIVRTNIALMKDGREFDAGYNAGLSDDSLPVLLDSIEYLNDQDQQIVAWRIASRYCQKLEESDLRSWNLSRRQVQQRIESNEELVREIGGCDEIKATRIFVDHHD